MATPKTNSLKRKGGGAEMQKLKADVLDLLSNTEASYEVAYYMIQDLSQRMDLPFYRKKSSADILKEYCALCLKHCQTNPNDDLAERLFVALAKQQNQHLRKISKRTQGQKNKQARLKKVGCRGEWEHPIPANYSAKLLINYIRGGKCQEIVGYIEFLERKTYQVFLKDCDHKKLDCYKDTMPDGWDWQKDDVFARYKAVGIPESEYVETV